MGWEKRGGSKLRNGEASSFAVLCCIPLGESDETRGTIERLGGLVEGLSKGGRL